ncbi:MAG TPA: DNA polymerase III subunit beta, partial [Pirellulales bacterium]|nr:DNA polymerase III subunit beta [Pirellulales bacterium]
VTCDREALLSAFQTAAGVVPSRSPKPILQNIKLDVTDQGAILLATDLEIGIRIHVPGIQAQVPGSAILPLGRFGSILRESSDSSLQLESDGQATSVRGERSQFKLPAENPQEFPAVADFNESAFHELPARLLRELIKRTIFATDNESSRYALGGVLLEMGSDKITGVGTDGRRLAKMEVPAMSVGGHQSNDTMTIVPAKAMQLIERALNDNDAEIQVAAHANEVLVRSPRVTIYSRLVEGRFPKWRDVFPQRTNTARVALTVGPLYSAVRQAAIVTSDESRGVDFSFENGTLVLSGQAAELGQSRVELPIAYDGAPLTITLDPRFVSDFLRVLDPEKVITLELKDAESAAVCTTDDGYGYVIMPLARDH